jgi:hypothetical protein
MAAGGDPLAAVFCPLRQYRRDALEKGLASALQRFHNCCTLKPLLSRGIFLKKMPPRTRQKMARKLWNRFGTPNSCRVPGQVHEAQRYSV